MSDHPVRKKLRFFSCAGLVILLVAGSVGCAVDVESERATIGESAPVATTATGSNADNGSVEPTAAPAAEVPEPTATSRPTVAPEPTPVPTPSVSVSVQNAIGSAESYLRFTAFSRSGLIEQLEFEGFSTQDATLAVDSMSVSWVDQAIESAESYLDFSAFSKSGLIEQLEFEGFTSADAADAVDSLAVSWRDEAAESAASYLDFSSFSCSGLIDQLIFEGFTNDEATYGVELTGLCG
jgi:hypothetical protein